jgi:hypothetical protein
MRHVRLKSARDIVFTSLYRDRRAQVLEEFLRQGAEIYVLAGALRDVIAAHYEGEDHGGPRDFDIGVAGIRREDFDAVVSAFGQVNRHGGYVLKDKGGPNWDVWRLEETIGLRKTGTPYSIENALRTFNFDCNAIALDVSTGLFLDAGAIRAISQKRVDFVHDAIRHSQDTFAAKALLIEIRLKYMLSDHLRHFVRSHLNCSSLAHEVGKCFPDFAIVSKGESHRQRWMFPLGLPQRQPIKSD